MVDGVVRLQVLIAVKAMRAKCVFEGLAEQT
jgi:hypothetical protein